MVFNHLIRGANELLFLLVIGLLVGCASKKLVSGQEQMKQSFVSGEYEEAEEVADSLKQENIYQKKDRVLYALEKGTINFYDNEFEESIKNFSNAETYIDQFFTKSAKRGIKAFIVNDNELAYNGEVYEDVYINGFKSLCYLKMDQYESALVEARRIVQKLQQAESKYQGLAETWSEVDTTKNEQIEWTAGTSQIHDSPLSHYLAGALYAKSGEEDDANIELKKLRKAIDNHQALSDSELEFRPAFEKITKPQRYNVMLTAFADRAPEKVADNIEVEDAVEDTDLKIAIPALDTTSSQVAYVEAEINDTLSTSLPLIEEMDKVARETFKIKKPIIVARATVRGILKTIGQDAAEDAIEDEAGGVWGAAAGKLMGAARDMSEQADLRGWQTMPGKAYTNLVKLPSGKHEVNFKYYSSDDELLYQEEEMLQLDENEKLEPLASIYPN